MQICICRIRVEYVKLEEICTIVSGGTPSRSKPNYWDNGNIPWIKIKDMKSKYINSAEEFITEEGLNNSSAKMLKSDTILYSIFATLGEVGILKIDACTNQAIAGLSLKEDSNILKEYLYYYLKSKKKDVNNLGRGVAQNNINLSLLKKFKIPVMPLHQQKKIVEVLDNVSSTTNNYERELALLDELVKARFVEMFGDVQDAKKRGGQQLKDICNTVAGGTPSTKHVEYYNGTIPWISTVSLGPNYIDGTTAKAFITQEAVDSSSTKIIPSGSILFGTRVGVGKSSINQVEMCTNQDIVAIIDLDVSKYNKLYIKYVLDTYQPYFDSIKKGATILGISSDDLKNIYVPDASLYEQNRFEKFVKQIDKSRLLSNHSLSLIKSIIF